MTAQSQLPNLDKIFRDDDEPDFIPSGGSNLAAIFGLQTKPEDAYSVKQISSKKSNIRYNIQQTAVLPKTEVLIAKAVYAFKLQNGQYVSMGKLGMALTGNIATKIYQIILYKSKQEYISIATVTCDFVYTVQTNNYTSYYDNNKENWSILFENNESYLEFATEIGLARYFSVLERGENVIYQDLMPSDKDVIAKERDSICIKYFVTTEIIQPFKTNYTMSQTMTVEISMDDNWERLLLGSGKGLKRILFLPSNKQISLGPGFPKKRDIVLIIEITDIRKENLPVSRTSSISEKASIISRMAKMGQSILPKRSLSSATDSEDTEDDIPHTFPHHKKIEQLEAIPQQKNLLYELPEEKNASKIITESRTEVPSIDSSTYKPLATASPFTSQWTSPYFATINRTVPVALDPGINMLLSESRITNAEIRMGMSKISDNVQKLLDKFHVLELQNTTTPTSDKAALDTSWKMLLALNASYTGMKDNELSKSTDVFDEKTRETQKISTLENDLKQLKEEKESLLRVNEDLNKKLQELGTKLANTNDEMKKTKEDLELAKNTIKRYKEENVNLEDRLSEYNREQHIHQTDIENKNKEIKQIMNKTYHILLERLADETHSNLSFDYVKSTIANTIKHITLQVLHEGYGKGDKDFEASNKTINSAVTTVKIDEKDIEKSISNADNNDDFSIKSIKTSRMFMPVFENEPPPVPLDGIDEVDDD